MKLRTSHISNSSSSCFILRDTRSKVSENLELTLTFDISSRIKYTLTKEKDVNQNVLDFLDREETDKIIRDIKEALKKGQAIHLLDIESKDFPYELVSENRINGLPTGVRVMAGGRWWG